jgi:hypothetical protein
MRWIFLLVTAATLSLGCHRPFLRPGTSGPPSKEPANCSVSLELHPGDACDGFFTDDGHACVACPSGAVQCLEESYGVYCAAAGGCAHDPLCKYRNLRHANPNSAPKP